MKLGRRRGTSLAEFEQLPCIVLLYASVAAVEFAQTLKGGLVVVVSVVVEFAGFFKPLRKSRLAHITI